MCNFVIRPIKSYATVDIFSADEEHAVKRGDYIQVAKVQGGAVVGFLNGNEELEVSLPLTTFVHTFTADQRKSGAVEKVREEEVNWYPKIKEKKDSKESK